MMSTTPDCFTPPYEASQSWASTNVGPSYEEAIRSFEVKTGSVVEKFELLFDARPPKQWQFAIDEVKGKYRKMAREFCEREAKLTPDLQLQAWSGSSSQQPRRPRASLFDYEFPLPMWAMEVIGKVTNMDPRFGLKLLEDIAGLICGISIAKSSAEVNFAFFAFFKWRNGNRSLLESFYNNYMWGLRASMYGAQVHNRFHIGRGIAVDLPEGWPTYPHEMQSGSVDDDLFEELIKGARMILDSYESFRSSDLYKKCYRFFMYVMSSAVFESIGIKLENFHYTKLQAEAIRSKYHMGPNFVFTCMDTLVFLCERGIQFVKTGEMSSFLHTPKFYAEWMKRVQVLKNQHAHFHNLEVANTNYFKFMAELNAAVAEGDSMSKLTKKLSDSDSYLVNKCKQDLEQIKLDVMSKEKSLESRKAPFSVVIFGGTAVAKSTFSRVLVSMYCNAFGLPKEDAYVYVRNAVDQYWVNFMTSMHTIILDDIAFMKPDVAANGGDPTVMEALQINNNVPFTPIQAALEDKGRTPLRCELMIATTNTHHLNANAYFACPGAVLRRFPWVLDIKIKEEYAKEGGLLDPSKVPVTDDGCYPDFWKIVVYEVVPLVPTDRPDMNARGHMLARYVKRVETENVDEFCSWFVSTADAYRSNQERTSESLKALKEVPLCMGRKIQECSCESARCAHFRKGCLRPLKTCSHSQEGCIPPVVQMGAPTESPTTSEEWNNRMPHTGYTTIYRCPDCLQPERNCECSPESCPQCWEPLAYCRCSQSSTTSTLTWDEGICSTCGSSLVECRCRLSETQAQAGVLDLLASDTPPEGLFDKAERVRTAVRCEQSLHGPDPNEGTIDNPYFVSIRPEVVQKHIDHYFTSNGEEPPERYSVGDACSEIRRANWVLWLRIQWWVLMFWLYRLMPLWIQVIVDWMMGRAWTYRVCMRFASYPLLWKVAFKYVGSRVENYVVRIPMKVKVIMAGLTLIGTTYAGFTMFRKFFPKKKDGTAESGLVDSIGHKPVPLEGASVRPNVWYKEDYETTTFDVGLKSRSWTQMSRSGLQERLLRNCVHFKFFWKKNDEFMGSMPNLAFAVCSNIFVTNAHAIPCTESFFIEVTRVRKTGGVTENVKIKCSRKQCVILPSLDLVFVQILDIPPFADLRGLLTSRDLRGVHKGFYIGRNEDASPLIRNVAAIKKDRWVMDLPARPEISLEQHIDSYSWNGVVEVPMEKGQCGSILISESAFGPLILGIHAASSTVDRDRSIAAAITREVVDEALKEFHVVNAGDVDYLSESAPKVLGPLHSKSPFRFIEKGVAFVYGSFLGFRPSPRSRVQKSVICDSLQDKGYELRHGAPVMKGWGPKRNALLAMVDPVSKMDPDILDHAAECYLEDLKAGIDRADLDKLGVIDLRTSVNGAAGMPYIEHINRSTSAGFPWMKSKKYFLEEDTVYDDGLCSPVKPNAEILGKVENCLEAYQRGERYNPIFCANLKDEATKFEKIEAQKTRVFAGAPFPWIIVGRMFYLTFLRLMFTYRFVFESAPGINATSPEWGEFYQNITKHGKNRMIAGDFKNFDKTMSARMILKVFWVYIKLAIYSGKYTAKDILCMWCIAFDIAFPWMYFFGDLVQFFGTNPSGHFMTVQVNGGANSIYMRYCYAVLSPEKSAKRFKEHVSLMTYGDDNIMSVSPEAPWFNHSSIAAVLASVGIEYTMADKSAESRPYIHIDECSFLKRSWRWDDDVGAILAPLDVVSIEKSLMIGVVSKTITPEAQAVECIKSAVREAFHHGRSYFMKLSADCKAAVLENDLSAYVADSTFPTYDALKEAFWEGSFKTLLLTEEVEDDA